MWFPLLPEYNAGRSCCLWWWPKVIFYSSSLHHYSNDGVHMPFKIEDHVFSYIVWPSYVPMYLLFPLCSFSTPHRCPVVMVSIRWGRYQARANFFSAINGPHSVNLPCSASNEWMKHLITNHLLSNSLTQTLCWRKFLRFHLIF